MEMNINICREGDIRFPFKGIRKKDIARNVEKILKILNLKNHSITVVITDNKVIQALNKNYRKKNKPTDVISFAEQDMPFPQNGKVQYLGDVFISFERAWQQYPYYSSSFKEEVIRLLVHGILHLVGYNHEKTKREKIRMFKKEEEIIRKLI